MKPSLFSFRFQCLGFHYFHRLKWNHLLSLFISDGLQSIVCIICSRRFYSPTIWVVSSSQSMSIQSSHFKHQLCLSTWQQQATVYRIFHHRQAEIEFRLLSRTKVNHYCCSISICSNVINRLAQNDIGSVPKVDVV